MLKKANIFSIISSGMSSKEVACIADIFRRFALVSIFLVSQKLLKKMKKYMYFHEIYSLFLSHVKSWKSNRPNWVKLLEIETGTQLKLRKAIFCKAAQDFRFVIVISYLLFQTAFIWRIFFLEKKNSVACLLKIKWLIKICIFRGTQIFLSNYNAQFFISHFVFKRQWAEFFLSKKKSSIKAGQNNKLI